MSTGEIKPRSIQNLSDINLGLDFNDKDAIAFKSYFRLMLNALEVFLDDPTGPG